MASKNKNKGKPYDPPVMRLPLRNHNAVVTEDGAVLYITDKRGNRATRRRKEKK